MTVAAFDSIVHLGHYLRKGSMELSCSYFSLFTCQFAASKPLLVQRNFLATKTLTCFQVRARKAISVGASSLCLSETARVSLFWHLLELETNRYNLRLRARSRAWTDTSLEESGSNSPDPTGERLSSPSSTSVPETLRSLRKAQRASQRKQNSGTSAKKSAAASRSRLIEAENIVHETPSSSTLVSR